MRKFGIGLAFAAALSLAVLPVMSQSARADGGATAALIITTVAAAGVTIGESYCKPAHGFFTWCNTAKASAASAVLAAGPFFPLAYVMDQSKKDVTVKSKKK